MHCGGFYYKNALVIKKKIDWQWSGIDLENMDEAEILKSEVRSALKKMKRNKSVEPVEL